jgi:hypothetical protein
MPPTTSDKAVKKADKAKKKTFLRVTRRRNVRGRRVMQFIFTKLRKKFIRIPVSALKLRAYYYPIRAYTLHLVYFLQAHPPKPFTHTSSSNT